jgi:hypothetical protein
MTFLELLAGLTLKSLAASFRGCPNPMGSSRWSTTRMSPGLTWACALRTGTIMLKAEAISATIDITFPILVFALAVDAISDGIARLRLCNFV